MMFAPAAPLVTQRTILLGQLISGGMTSRRTVTVNVLRSSLPQSSFTEQTTVVIPSGKTLPDGGTQVTVGVGSLPGMTVGGGYCTGTPLLLQVQATMFVGHRIPGGWLWPGMTRTGNSQL